MAQLKDLIVNGATRLLNGLNVSGSIKQNSEQVVTKINNIAPDDSGHLSVSIPTVNNATLTINQNNTSKGTFTANSSTNTTINLTDTTYSSQAAASGGTAVSLVTTGEKYTWNNKGTYSKPSGGIPKTDLASAVQTSLGRADTALQSAPVTSVNSKTGAVSLSASDVGAAATSHTHTKSQITDFPTLATVATSGSYNDLSNKPTIPPAVTVDTAISSTSTNPVQNKVIKTALDGKVSTVSGKGLSTNDYTTTEKNKLAGIASGAEVNVQADWNQTNTGADDYIKNKPTIPAAATIYHSLGQNTDGAIDQKVVTDAINNSLQFGDYYNEFIEVDIASEELDAVGLARHFWVSNELSGKVPTTRKVNGKALSSDVTLGSADILVAGDRTIDDAFSSINTNINNLSTSKVDTTDPRLSDARTPLTHTHDDRYYTESEVNTKLDGKVSIVSGKGLSTNDFTTTLKNKLDGIASGAEVNVQSDWNATSGDALILNKPTFVAITSAEIDTICS